MEVVHNSPFSNITESEARSYETFPCLCERRSYPRPVVVGEVALQDIDIIGAIGDSDTAAFAANSRGLDYFTEYWGSSFVTGDQLYLLNKSINVVRSLGDEILCDLRDVVVM